jgi:hypothetical protein
MWVTRAASSSAVITIPRKDLALYNGKSNMEKIQQ